MTQEERKKALTESIMLLNIPKIKALGLRLKI